MKSAEQVFDGWARDDRARRMGEHHWGVVRQGLALLPESDGPYLEVGVGAGSVIRHVATGLHREGRCLGIDVSERMVALAREATKELENVTIERASFVDPAFSPGDGTFATVFSMEVFYYFPDLQAGLDRAASLLRPGGRLVVMVDFHLENGASHDWPEELDTPMTLWSRDQYRQGFERAGIRNVEQHLFVDPARSSKDPDEVGTLCTLGLRP